MQLSHILYFNNYYLGTWWRKHLLFKNFTNRPNIVWNIKDLRLCRLQDIGIWKLWSLHNSFDKCVIIYERNLFTIKHVFIDLTINYTVMHQESWWGWQVLKLTKNTRQINRKYANSRISSKTLIQRYRPVKGLFFKSVATSILFLLN